MNKKRRMKYIGLIMLLAGILMIVPLSARAEGGGTGSGGSGHGGQEGTTKFDYYWATENGKHYIKITAYTYSGKEGERPIRISDSRVFTNYNKNDPIKGKNILHAVNQPSDKLSYLDGNTTLNVKKSKIDMTYLDFPELGSDALRNWFLKNVIETEDNTYTNKINQAINLDEEKLKKVNGYYYIVESIGYAKYGYAGGESLKNQLHFFGTAYEMAAYNKKNSGSYPTIQTWVGTALYIPNNQKPDNNGFVGKIFYQLNPSTQVNNRNCDGCNKLKWDELTNYNGYGLNVFWKEREMFLCNKAFNSHFPIDPNTHEVLPVVLNSADKDDATIATSKDITENKAVNCCLSLLQEEFGNDKDKLCDERPECCYDCDPGKGRDEENPSVCTTSSSGVYQDAGNDKNTWYCIKAFDQFSPYKKENISYNGTVYARVVCKETLVSDYPKKINPQQSVGTYMTWPTSSNQFLNNNKLVFNGVMTCKLSIDKAEIDASGNANGIYSYIYDQVKTYVNSNTAENWYNLNPNSTIKLTYNDDEYGGIYVNLEKDETSTTVDMANNNSSDWYSKLNSLTISINKIISYKLPKETYMKLTTSGTGSSKLNNMHDDINKNEYVIPMFDYGILPISYKAKPNRNISVNNIDYYKLTLKYSNIGDNGQFVKGEKEYTCPYEVTFAPPTSPNENPECGITKEEVEKNCGDKHDDNNESYELTNNCVCSNKTTYAGMQLNGYIIKNNGMTCSQAQELYCNGGRGHMNVEYRVISLTEPFPGINGIPYINGGRKIGYNWRDQWDNPYAGEVVKNVIINNRGVTGYEVYDKEPLYTIKLNSATITAIRQYNKNNNYSDFTLSCKDKQGYGKRCISNFLRGSGDTGVGNLLSGGTCANATSYSDFYSCADKADPGMTE